MDSTSFSVAGEYANSMLESANAPKPEDTDGSDARPIQIRYGYSRDHRSDLKQFVMNLICSGDSGIPLFLSMADGNQVDSQVFGGLMSEFAQQWDFDGIHVADAALYTADNLKQMGRLQWVSRVPLSVGAASGLLDESDPVSFVASERKGYATSMVCNDYAAVNQHWVVVRSEARQAKDLEQLETNIQKAQTKAQAALNARQGKTFECPVVAQSMAQQLNDQLRYHHLTAIEAINIPHYGKAGRPNKGTQPTHFTYRVSASIEPDRAAIEQAQRRAGCFILATPVFEDKPDLCADDILSYYKDQEYSERGFRFCKDPMFFADSIFLKNPNRIEAVGFIMGLCLLVYSLGQRYLRQALADAAATVPNQLGKPTARPTLRWIFQCFQAVHLLVIDGIAQVVNLNDERLWILNFFPKPCLAYYLIC